MADLNLRDVDAELIKELKRAAVEADVSLKEECLRRLRGQQMIIARPKAESPIAKAREIVRVPAREEKPTACPKCHALNGNHFKGCK
jgi:hypothetical protein